MQNADDDKRRREAIREIVRKHFPEEEHKRFDELISQLSNGDLQKSLEELKEAVQSTRKKIESI